MKPISNFFKRWGTRFAYMYLEADTLSNHLAQLALALRYIPSSPASAPLPMVLVSDRRSAIFVELFRWTGQLPPLNLKQVADAIELEACLAELELSEDRGVLFIAGDVFARYHAQIAASPAGQARHVA